MEILRLHDPVISTIAFLGQYFENVRDSVPYQFDWRSPLVVVTDAGGTGERDVVLDDVILSFRVFDKDKFTASERARTIHGLLRAWPDLYPDVTWNGTVQRPTFDPDDETRTPGYSFSVRLIFRAHLAPEPDRRKLTI